MPKVVALMDKYNPTGFTEGVDFLCYVEGFFERGCTVFQLDHFTINFEEGTARVYFLKKEKGKIKRINNPVTKKLSDFDFFVNLGSSIGKDFAEKFEKVPGLKFNPPLEMCRSADKRTYVKYYNEFIPETIFTKDPNVLVKTLQKFLGLMVVKTEVNGSCGNGVLKIDVKEKGFLEKLRRATNFGEKEVVAQKLLSFANEGSKRVAVIGIPSDPSSYRVIHFYGRRPSKNDWRDNLDKGGELVEIDSLRKDEVKLCLEVARKSGLFGVGLDIMDDLDEKGGRVSKLIETNSVLAFSAYGKYSEEMKKITNFILDVLV